MQRGIETPQKIRFIKFLYELGGSAKSGEIAGHFGVSSATVARSLRELAGSGYLIQNPYHEAVLTEKGEEFARYLYRRHRILALMFTRCGLSDEEACKQAKLIEHLVTRENVNQICRSFGHPRQSSCGIIENDPVCCNLNGE